MPIGPPDYNASRQGLATGDFNGDGADDVIVLGTKGLFYLIDGSGAVRVQQAVSVALHGVCALPKNDQGKQAFVIGGGKWWCCCEEE